jgi:hypothetical protein
MTLLTLNEGGLWYLDYEVEPVEFWPYTTHVRDVVFSAPRKEVASLNEELLRIFKAAGIKAYADNKCAFGMRDHKLRMWYLGFKDFTFNLGLSVEPDQWLKPIKRE